jgi:hypothetical protein
MHSIGNPKSGDSSGVSKGTGGNKMTDPTAKGYTASPDAALRDVKAAVTGIFPEAYAWDTGRGGFDIIDVLDRDRAMSVGYGKTEYEAWADANSRQNRFTAKAAPESEDEAFERAWDAYTRPCGEKEHHKPAAKAMWNVRARMDGSSPDTECTSCNITAEGHEFDCPEAQE